MGSGTQQSTTNQTSTTTPNGPLASVMTPLVTQAANTAATPYSSAMNSQVASLTPQQLQAIQGLGGLATNNPASGYINQAANYSAMASDPNNVNAMTQQYYNPMASNVMAQLQNVYGQQNAQLKGNEAASGALGGSRSAVADSTLANQQGLAAGQTMAGLYNQALSAAQTTAGQQQASAYTMGNLGSEALNTQIAGLNQGLLGGNQLQQQGQNVLNAQTQNAIQSTLFPQQELSTALQQAAYGTTLGGTTTGQGTTQTPINYTGNILGGLTAGLGLFSDERVKENIEPIGKTFDKQTIYSFRYKGDPQTRIGLMAQEVQKKHPDAIGEVAGIKTVDYKKATEKSVAMGERKHRDIGGGVYSSLSSRDPLSALIANQPNSVPNSSFPTLNLNPQQNNQAQQQNNQLASQYGALGQALGKSGIGSSLNTSLGNTFFGSDPTTSDGGWQTSTQPTGGFIGGLGSYFGAARGGRIHLAGGGSPTEPLTDTYGDRVLFQGPQDLPPEQWPSQQDGTATPFQRPIPHTSDYPASATPTAVPPVAASETAPPLPANYINQPAYGAPSAFSPQQIASLTPAPAQPQPAQPAAPPPVAGSAQAAGHPGYEGLTQPQSVAQMGADTLRNLGWSDNAIRGALANGNPESGFNPNQRHWDQPNPIFGGTEAANAHGIFSLGGSEYNQYISWLGKNGFTPEQQNDPVLQYRYLDYSMKHQHPEVFDAMQKAGTPQDAAKEFLGGFLKPRADLLAQRAAQIDKNGVPETDALVKGAGQGFQDGAKSILDKPEFQPPPPGQSYLDRTMKAFGIDLNQPQTLGGSLGRALGVDPLMSQQNSNRLVNMGLGMMAAPPTVGVKGFPGAAISALTAAGKGGQFVLSQDAADRAEAAKLAAAAMQQQHTQTQIAKEQFEMSKPQPMGSSVVYLRDPITQMLTAHTIQNYGTKDEKTGKWTPLSQDENLKLNGLGGASASLGSANPPAQQFPNSIPLPDGTTAQIPSELQGKIDANNPIDVRAVRVVAGQEPWPAATKGDQQATAVQMKVRQLDPTYSANRYKFYEQYGGPNGKVQTSFNAFGTALTHARILDDANHNANVTDTGWSPANRLVHLGQRSIGDSELKNYEDASSAYAKEHEKALVPSGQGSALEREEMIDRVASKIPQSARLSGNAANVEILLGKMLKLDDAYEKGMGRAASMNRPTLLTKEDRATLRDIFDHEPSEKLKQQRYDRLSKDPRTADLVSPPITPPKPDLIAKATDVRQNKDGHTIGLINNKWTDLGTGEALK